MRDSGSPASVPSEYPETTERFGDWLRGMNDPGHCPIRNILDLMGDKWSILVVLALAERTHRFSALSRLLHPISKRVLAQSLRDLEREGLVTRNVLATKPPSVKYELTPTGYSFLGPLQSVTNWSTQNYEAMAASRSRFDDIAS